MINEEVLKSKLADLVQASKKFAIQQSKQEADAEDALQDAFLYTFEHPPEKIEDLESHFRIILRRCISGYKHRKESSVPKSPYYDEASEEMVDPEDLKAYYKNVCLTGQPEWVKRAFQYLLDGFTTKEIAELEKKAYSTIANKLAELKELIKERENLVIREKNPQKRA